VFRFLDNNDTGQRFVTRHGPALTRAAAALVLTLPGTPCVYTGEEVGAEYEPYGAPGVVDWDRDRHGLREWYRSLCRLRTERAALRGDGWTRTQVAHGRGDCYAFIRHGGRDDEPLLVLVNFGDEEVGMQVGVPDEFGALGSAEVLTDVLNLEEIPGTRAGIPVPGGSARVLAASAGERQ
jgi:cyclomaltodextrinase / maltogenic alpha-amylase / neopullulanase